ncbi:MAG: 50S ribosomal protein L29 [Clostridiales bacterium]|jgi:large subunit ribosomal protein L29|nr:50S ribosomal protein L29 [Clostridiales bacterium]HOB63615.1 50S ribosomal protein L29 [Clostridia bacterium]HOK81968.1 50S ribosomal protein L29 [Clostridia bacterium]HOL61218.1 50S ribosomal protein L29 [Clostridia bacterium]HPO53896.1 50S ribosomal protein L29 [Clostridia bacterium]
MKAKTFFEMSDKELINKIAELKEELFNLRFKHAINQLPNPMVISQCKKDIARAKTVLNQRATAAKKASK